MQQRPNWKNPEDYKYTEKHSNKMWAWEFLRRNPSYCEYWEESIGEYRDILKQLKEMGLKNNKPRLFNLGAALLGTPKNIADALKPAPDPDIIVSVDDDPEDHDLFYIFRHSTPEKWGVPILQNPDQNKPWWYFYPSDIKIFGSNDLSNAFLSENEVAIKIILTKPLTPQLKKYDAQLRKRQSENQYQVASTKKRGGTVWRDYLRVLDADAEGIYPKKAAPIIFPNKTSNAVEHYNGCKKIAKKLMRDGYRKWL